MRAVIIPSHTRRWPRPAKRRWVIFVRNRVVSPSGAHTDRLQDARVFFKREATAYLEKHYPHVMNTPIITLVRA